MTFVENANEFNYFFEDWINDIFEYLKLERANFKDLESLFLFLLNSLREGNLCISLKDKTTQVLMSSLFKQEDLYERIRLLQKNEVFEKIFAIHDDSYIFFRKHYQALITLKQKLQSLKNNNFYKDFELTWVYKVKEYLSFISSNLNPEQILSVLLSTVQPFLVISGGPGTGKTTVASHIIGVHLFLGISPEKIIIAAPTGRAASRLKESIDKNLKKILKNNDFQFIKPYTIHRLLKFNPIKNEFFYNQNNLLKYQLYIIDEASMIDIFLIQNLFFALQEFSNNTKIIFLGDKNQLPSILEGNVLEDLIPKKESFPEIKNLEDFINKNYNIKLEIKNPYYIHLKTSYRNVKEIKYLADLIIEEESSKKIFEYLNPYKHTSLESHSPIVWLEEKNKNSIYKLIINFIEKNVINNFFLQKLEIIQSMSKEEWDLELISKIYERVINYKVLAPTRLSNLGILYINQMIQEKLMSKRIVFGFPILITENDYYNQLFNGDIGVLLRDKHQNELVCFKTEANFNYYSLLSLKKYEVAFAMTIHKSQGSEYKEVFIVLPEITEEYKNFKNLLNKKTLYTAITRAKEKLYLIGSKEALRFCIENSPKRISGINLWE